MEQLSTVARPGLTRAPREQDTWYYPPDIANDLKDVNLPDQVKAEVFACAWEYSRSVIPQYTNWNRYLAFMRTIIMWIIAEFEGSLGDMTAGDEILGYSLTQVLASLFEGTPGHENMVREYQAFILISAEKASDRRSGELFRRYVNSWSTLSRIRHSTGSVCVTVMRSPGSRLRRLWRATTWTMFGSPTTSSTSCARWGTQCTTRAFYKHRSEGETNSTFAYVPDDMRVKAYRQCREVLWALDTAWARQLEMQGVINFVRIFGGTIHMLMRRYRLVEEDLTIGKPETEAVVAQTRAHFKLWNRVDANKMKDVSEESIQRYQKIIARSDELLFRGLAEFLKTGGDGHCDSCRYRTSYGAETIHRFGGVELCGTCRNK
ncbi:hypothetical protein C8R43DRAFT_518863 [Mycena crocata]|nr:hypothetical protein C8R43DRAFT_518863 [Mycena crocata]